MSNVIIEASLVNNDLMPIVNSTDNCKYAVKIIAGDDTGAPVQNLRIIVKTESGKTVRVTIPNSSNSSAIVQIDGDKV